MIFTNDFLIYFFNGFTFVLLIKNNLIFLTTNLNFIIMKKSLFVAAFAALALVACDKTATKEKWML
jgi:hypothetical protein